ncbi:hypothetical protein E2C01_015819 [Portunus trituberculatus]|uniref:Uncharacterized protein n=1 Tax=Portunus trituberculatus TaxID=210409 RepID=A0A5B7DMG3_PORTR|nr:hypothetical protein [Portunus trituberculatus]
MSSQGRQRFALTFGPPRLVCVIVVVVYPPPQVLHFREGAAHLGKTKFLAFRSCTIEGSQLLVLCALKELQPELPPPGPVLRINPNKHTKANN